MRRYSRAEAQKKIGKILKDGSVSYTSHVRKRMVEREFDTVDLIFVLTKGNIYREPEPQPTSGEWVYTVEGFTIDGDLLKLPVVIKEKEKTVIVLTGMKEKGRIR
jgi:hypothetical protein